MTTEMITKEKRKPIVVAIVRVAIFTSALILFVTLSYYFLQNWTTFMTWINSEEKLYYILLYSLEGFVGVVACMLLLFSLLQINKFCQNMSKDERQINQAGVVFQQKLSLNK